MFPDTDDSVTTIPQHGRWNNLKCCCTMSRSCLQGAACSLSSSHKSSLHQMSIIQHNSLFYSLFSSICLMKVLWKMQFIRLQNTLHLTFSSAVLYTNKMIMTIYLWIYLFRTFLTFLRPCGTSGGHEVCCQLLTLNQTALWQRVQTGANDLW